MKHELLPLICLYFREFRFDAAKITNHDKKNKAGDINLLSNLLVYFYSRYLLLP